MTDFVAQPTRSRSHLGLAATAFFASGVSALVYQVSWQRILALQSGVGTYSVAMIVAAFMAGLGGGSHLGARLTTKVGPHRALHAFAALELGIAAFGASSCWVYYDWLYVQVGWLYALPWRAAALHLLGLLVPTTLMGMSLPFLVRGMVTELAGADRRIGLLYGINVVGASLGALLTPWILLRLLGVRGAVAVAVAGNLLAAGMALVLARARRHVQQQVPALARAPQRVEEGAGGRPLTLWLALYATSGFVALSLEILWFRILDVAVKSTGFTFGTVLFVYLLGSGLGATLGSLVVKRVARPLATFLWCQCLLIAYAVAAVAVMVLGPAELPVLRWLVAYWSQPEAFDLGLAWQLRPLLMLYFVLPVALFGPPTLLMGFSFPVLQRAVQDDPATAGRKVGLLQAANIAGCIAGSLLVGLLLLSVVQTSGTLRLLLGLGVGLAALGVHAYGLRSSFTPLAALMLALALVLPDHQSLWRRLHGAAPGAAFVEEDATSVSVILRHSPRQFRVFVNGRNHSWLPYGGIHTLLGALPAVVHPRPLDVAIIGLGSGDTAWSVACRRETRSLSVYEIAGSQPRLLRRVADVPTEDPGLLRQLRWLLADPRLRLEVADGRNAIDLGERRYDVIQADPLWFNAAYAGNLYSLEYFQRMARRLKPGGLMCTWAPTERTRRTFRAAFDSVVAFQGGAVLIGSKEVIRVQRRIWRRRLEAPQVVEHLGGERVVARIIHELRFAQALPPLPADGRRDLNHDLFPRDEFNAR